MAKNLGKNIKGTENISQTDNEIVVLGDFDENGGFVAFIGPGGRRFTAGTAGVNQLLAGTGIALTPSIGTGTVRVDNTRQGTVSSVGLRMPAPFLVTDSPVTVSGDLQVAWGIGQIPATNITSGPYVSDYFVNSLGLSTPVVATSIPYRNFLGSVAGGANQTFSDVVLLAYAGDETRLTLLSNGVVLTPVESYTLTGDTITIIDNLLPSAEIDVISKAITAAGVTIGTVSNVSVGTSLNTALRFTSPTLQPTLELAANINSPTLSYLRGDGTFSTNASFLTRSADVLAPYQPTLTLVTVTALTATTLTLSGNGFTVGQYISATTAPFLPVRITAVTGTTLQTVTVSFTTQWSSAPPLVMTSAVYTWQLPADNSILTYNQPDQQYISDGYFYLDTSTTNLLISKSNSSFASLIPASHTANVILTTTGAPSLMGSNNTLFGHLAGVGLATATGNTFVGTGAGSGILASLNNTCIGLNAGANLASTSSGNVALGNTTFANTQGVVHTNCIAIGANALAGGTATGTSQNNIAIGAATLQSHTTGFQNIAIGISAGQLITTASNNMLIGTSAGAALSTGFSNNFIGFSSGLSCTLSSRNTIIGSFSGVQTSSPVKPTDLDITTANSNYFVISDTNLPANILAVCTPGQNWGFGNSAPLGRVHVEGALRIQQAWEKAVTSTTVLTGTIPIPVGQAGEFLFTANATANWTFNFTGSNPDAVPAVVATLDSILPIGHSVTIAIITTQGATAFFCNAVQIDGVVVTPRWQGATAPAFGSANGNDIYSFTIVKSAAATYRVLGSRTQYGG